MEDDMGSTDVLTLLKKMEDIAAGVVEYKLKSKTMVSMVDNIQNAVEDRNLYKRMAGTAAPTTLYMARKKEFILTWVSGYTIGCRAGLGCVLDRSSAHKCKQ